jgi:lysophospholipase L1-like esterase
MGRRSLLTLAGLVLIAGAWLWLQRRPWPIANTPPQPGIVLLGDSLTVGVGVGGDEVYHRLLPGLLGLPSGAFAPRGISGRTLADARGTLAQEVLSTNAGTVIVLLGGNDQLRVRSAEDALADAEEIVRTLVADGRMVVLCDFSPLPLHHRWSRGFRRIAREQGAILVPDLVDGLYGTDSDSVIGDNIHLNAAGQRVVAERIAEALRPHLAGGAP